MAPTFDALRGEYAALWRDMIPDPQRAPAILARARRMLLGLGEYRGVEAATGVPAAVVAVIHEREAACRFDRHLHNGDPLNARTVHVPAGRPARGAPPFSWSDSAIDALRYQGLDRVPPDQWSVARAAFALEVYNGFGYRNRRLRSPYLWGATNLQQPGKYVRDGVFDPTVTDTQIGAMPLLQKLWSLEPSLRLPAVDLSDGRRDPRPPAPPPGPRRPPPLAPAPAVQGLIAAAVAALVGGVVAFRDAVMAFAARLFGG
jgi:lysozyme family protein